MRWDIIYDRFGWIDKKEMAKRISHVDDDDVNLSFRPFYAEKKRFYGGAKDFFTFRMAKVITFGFLLICEVEEVFTKPKTLEHSIKTDKA